MLPLIWAAVPALALPGPARKRSPNSEKAEAVVGAFQIAWTGYMDNAFPNDTLKPISNVGVNDRSYPYLNCLIDTKTEL